LSNATRHADGTGADVRDREQVEHLADRAVLTDRSVQQREHRGRGIAPERRDQHRVDIAFVDLETDRTQDIAHPTSGPQRHLPLVREAAGENEHTPEVTHELPFSSHLARPLDFST
jgi:hypothetical protein